MVKNGTLDSHFTGYRVSGDKKYRLNRVYPLYEERLCLELLVARLDSVLVGAEGVLNVVPMDQDELPFLTSQLSQILLVCFEFFFERHWIDRKPQFLCYILDARGGQRDITQTVRFGQLFSRPRDGTGTGLALTARLRQSSLTQPGASSTPPWNTLRSPP
jgi:hypothetical protein